MRHHFEVSMAKYKRASGSSWRALRHGLVLSLARSAVPLGAWLWVVGRLGRLARERHLLSQLGNERNDSLYHPYKRLDLVGEIEECLDGDDRMLDIGTRRCSHLHVGEEGAALRIQGHDGQLRSPPRDAKWPCLAVGTLAISSPSSSAEYVVQLYVKAEMSAWLDSIQVRMIVRVDRLNRRLVDRIEVNDSKPLLVS
ncbi:hypothetical protein BHE74_00046231 [Ensete ventricosum]|nr:hypothetical protein BHE74_00046231 [Ensete ventricosum]